MDILDLRDLSIELNTLRDEKEANPDTFAENDRLAVLESLEKEFNGDLETVADNEPTLIADSSFEAYAQELAEDTGALDRGLANTWPYTCIDWSRAAEELQHDYTQITFDGETYWTRDF